MQVQAADSDQFSTINVEKNPYNQLTYFVCQTVSTEFLVVFHSKMYGCFYKQTDQFHSHAFTDILRFKNN